MTRPFRPSRSSERGAALLVAVVAIAVLTALAVDLAYETQVRLRIAGNARDELRAEALAHSAVNVSRLVLGFQNQIDVAMAANSPPQTASGTSGGTNPTSILPRPQIWNLIPVSSALTHALFGDGGSAPAAKRAEQASGASPAEGTPAVVSASYGDFEGGFQARIEDEAQKVNVQLDGLMKTSTQLGPQVEALLRLICDPKWDPLFDRTDADGQRYTRADLIIHLRDWVDDDATASGLKASFPGGNCSFVLQQPPFEPAFSDENFAYDRGTDRYKAKNNRMDSVDELSLVAGVSDVLMAAFGDQLTVYLPRDAPMNVNSDDVQQQLRMAALVGDPNTVEIKRRDPVWVEAFHKALSDARMGGFVTITPVLFMQLVQAQGVPLRTDIPTGTKSPFTDRSTVFRVRAFGVAGDVTHETEAVVSFDPSLIPQNERLPLGVNASGQLNMGRLVHWREE